MQENPCAQEKIESAPSTDKRMHCFVSSFRHIDIGSVKLPIYKKVYPSWAGSGST